MKYLFYSIFLFLLIDCKSDKKDDIVYSGSAQDAIINNILTRRSIRKYKDKQVEKEKLDKIMKAAIFAPSARNKQPWEVRVIQSPALLKEITKRFITYSEGKDLHGVGDESKKQGYSATFNAPTFIVIARDKDNETSYLDCGILLQNILLSAHGLNLGTCPNGTLVPFLNAETNKDLLHLLNIPENYEVAITATLGYADENPSERERFAERVKIIK